MIARVVPLTRTRAVRGAFDYRLPAGREPVQVGSVLRVPFGGRRALGVVVELTERSELEPDRLAEPEAVLAASIPEPMVALAEWMAHEYCSTPARALSLMLAPGAGSGMTSRRVLVAELTPAGVAALQAPPPRLSPAQRRTAAVPAGARADRGGRARHPRAAAPGEARAGRARAPRASPPTSGSSGGRRRRAAAAADR